MTPGRATWGLLALLGGLWAGSVGSQTLSVTLGWEYPLDEEVQIDRFVLQRRDGDTDWADLPLLLLPQERRATDPTGILGTRYRYRVLAERTDPPPLLRSAPSNEVSWRAKPGKGRGR